MKKSGFIATLAAGMILLAGCGSTQKEIDAAALAKSLVSDITYDDQLEQINDEDISYSIDVPKGVDAIMYMGSGSTAEEVAVFTAPDEETARTTEENVQSFEKYIPEETKRISNAVLEKKGKYVVLCVCGDSDKAKEIIEKAFK